MIKFSVSVTISITWLLSSLVNASEGCGKDGHSCRYGQTSCVNSKCLYGCEPGWTGNGCNDQCYINHCLECVNLPGKTTQKCVFCEPGFYGDSCENVCSENCLFGSHRCSKEGHCLYGCKPNFQGYKCQTPHCDILNCQLCRTASYGYHYCHVCSDGMYWEPGNNKCINCTGKCAGGSHTCNTTLGTCPEGCQTGWFGSKCNQQCTIPHCLKCQERNYRSAICANCEEGWYKKDGHCKACSDNCIGGINSCDKETGHCMDGCTLGWYGRDCSKNCTIENCKICTELLFGGPDDDYCKECEKGWFWHYKNRTCTPCTDRCFGGRYECNVTNGLCLHGCADGYYGIQCQWTCSAKCVNGTCDSVTGHCDHGCTTGWYGPRCDRRCPLNCRSCADFINGVCGDCEAGSYGLQCELKCNSNCKGSDYNNFIYCEKYSGKCLHGCGSGYYGDNCNLTCSQKCFSGNCEQSTGECNFGCNSVWYGNKCDKRCPKNCENSQSVNSRQCDQITGLCVYGCAAGYFGQSCERSCSNRCKFRACDRYSGYCTQGCENGYYGENCTQTCNINCENHTCYQKGGHCLSCKEGYFGEFCKYPCYTNCFNTCDKNSGFCLKCKNGFYGSLCNKECLNCYNGSCDQYTGHCRIGCIEGMTGQDCLDSCSPGFYGQNCKETCGHCKDGTPCYMTSGECQLGCDVGWTGLTCHDGVKVAGEVKQQKSEAGTAAVTGGAIGGVLLVIVVIVMMVFVIRQRKNFIRCTKKRSDTIDSQNLPTENGQIQHMPLEMETAPAIVCHQPHDWVITQSDLQIQHLLIFDGQFYDLAKGSLKQSDSSDNENQVTVKILRNNSSQALRQNFFHEIEILKLVKKHSNIMEFIGVTDTEDSDVYSVFNETTSTDLLRYLHNLRGSSAELPSVVIQECTKELLNFSLDIVTGLAFLHESGIIHGCMAAINIFIAENFTPKIGNFYYSSICNDRGEIEKSKERPMEQFIGWMPPELLKNTIKSIECDMWSFGVLLWEVFTLGDTPYDRSDNKTKARQIIEGRKLQKPDGCHNRIYKVMSRCWIDFPSQRPSADQLIRDFKRFLSYTDLMDDSITCTVTTVV